uniref:Uncharacterized protein n=1 Tax=Utricularia reniformis TaxID=192314 RepID=A0A1Y0AYN0_9LAMI|nr:hypothetical protein AEK19_MT0222 [Utricularia reniformis]ART30265.1 hypothetical protein AEK19_MT0222 [Utricularia reniformis]
MGLAIQGFPSLRLRHNLISQYEKEPRIKPCRHNQLNYLHSQHMNEGSRLSMRMEIPTCMHKQRYPYEDRAPKTLRTGRTKPFPKTGPK